MHKLELAKTCGNCKHGDFTNTTSRYHNKPRYKVGKCLLMENLVIQQQNTCEGWQEGHSQRCSAAKKCIVDSEK